MKIILLLVLLSTALLGQEDYTFNSYYRTFNEGESFFTLNTKTAVRVAPFLTATELYSLPVGYPIRVEERMDELFKINGFRTNWYRVTYEQNGIREEGFVWGGDIAIGSFVSKANSKTLFLYGISEIKMVDRGNYYEESIRLKLVVSQNQKTKDELVFEAMGTLYTQTQGKALGNKGVSDIEDVIEVAFSDGYCGGVSASVTVFWDGQNMHYINLLSNGFSSEAFANKYYIYPGDSEGQPNLILLRDEAGSYNSNKEAFYSRQINKKYIWTGQLLKAVD